MDQVAVDLLERFPNKSPHPDTHVRRQTVHQSETGNGFEFVYVQLHVKEVVLTVSGIVIFYTVIILLWRK